MPGFEHDAYQAFGWLEVRPYGLLATLDTDLDFAVADLFSKVVAERVTSLRPRAIVLAARRRFVDVRGFGAIEAAAAACERTGSRLYVAEPSWSLRFLWETLAAPPGVRLCEELTDAEVHAANEV